MMVEVKVFAYHHGGLCAKTAEGIVCFFIDDFWANGRAVKRAHLKIENRVRPMLYFTRWV